MYHIATEQPVHDERIERYMDISARTQPSAMGDSCCCLRIRFSPDRGFILNNLIRRYISYLNGQWHRGRSHHLKYIYRDRIVSMLNKSHKKASTRQT